MRLSRCILVASLVATFGATTATAGGGCRDCVEVRPAHTEFVHEPAVVGQRIQRIETAPGYFTAVKHPAQYGSYQKSVMVAPAKVQYASHPAQYETRHETVVVTPASVRYEMKPDRHGRLIKCAVHVPAVTKTVERRVLVSPAHTTVVNTIPAQYATVTSKIKLAPARIQRTYTPPKVAYVQHPITLKGPTVRAIHHPEREIPVGYRR